MPPTLRSDIQQEAIISCIIWFQMFLIAGMLRISLTVSSFLSMHKETKSNEKKLIDVKHYKENIVCISRPDLSGLVFIRSSSHCYHNVDIYLFVLLYSLKWVNVSAREGRGSPSDRSFHRPKNSIRNGLWGRIAKNSVFEVDSNGNTFELLELECDLSNYHLTWLRNDSKQSCVVEV